MKSQATKKLKKEDLLDIEQCTKYLKETIEPLKYLEQLANQSKKICQFIMQELRFPFILNENMTMNISNSVGNIIQKAGECVVYLHEEVSDPIQSFFLHDYSKMEQISIEGKVILDTLIKQRRIVENCRDKYYETKELQETANESMLKLVKSVEANSISFKSKIELSSSNLFLHFI